MMTRGLFIVVLERAISVNGKSNGMSLAVARALALGCV